MTDEDRSLTDSVGKLIGAAADLGIAVARAASKVTSGGREPPAGPPAETAVAAIIRHGIASVVNVVSQVISAANQAVGGGSEARPATAPARVPQVRPGATLRVPLSIENPSREPMVGLTPCVARWLRDGNAAPDAAKVLFEPEAFDIAPLDFEKLTVFVSVPDVAPPGRYRLIVRLAHDAEAELSFEVA